MISTIVDEKPEGRLIAPGAREVDRFHLVVGETPEWFARAMKSDFLVPEETIITLQTHRRIRSYWPNKGRTKPLTEKGNLPHTPYGEPKKFVIPAGSTACKVGGEIKDFYVANVVERVSDRVTRLVQLCFTPGGLGFTAKITAYKD